MGIRNNLTRDKWIYKIYLYKQLIFDYKFYFKRKTYSQFGEDLFIENFFSNKHNGIYVDIGCYHPIKYSNTAKLFNKGWRGYNIDINQTSIDFFKIVRPRDKNIHTFLSNDSKKKIKYYSGGLFDARNSISRAHLINCGIKKIYEEYVISEKFDNLLNEKFDFLNIDCEGSDFEVLKLIDLIRFEQALICIEILDQKINTISDYLKDLNYEFINNKELSYFFKKKDK